MARTNYQFEKRKKDLAKKKKKEEKKLRKLSKKEDDNPTQEVDGDQVVPVEGVEDSDVAVP